MFLSGKDKLYHMAACASITLVTFLALLAARRMYYRQGSSRGHEAEETGAPAAAADVEAPPANEESGNAQAMTTDKCNLNRVIRKDWVLFAISSLAALLIGIAKEIGDMYNVWWLCQAKNPDGSMVGCHASWGDLLADIVGIILANAVIVTFLWVWNYFEKKTRSSAEYAMASTTDT